MNIVLMISPRRPMFIGAEFISQIILCTQDSPSKPNLQNGGFYYIEFDVGLLGSSIICALKNSVNILN